MTQKSLRADGFESLEMVTASLKVMEATLLGIKQARQCVGDGVVAEIPDSLIGEAESQISAIKRRVLNWRAILVN